MSKFKSKPYRVGTPAVWAHAKLDGHFTRVIKDYDGLLYVLTSNPTNITHLIPDHLKYPMLRGLPNGTTVLGELWAPGFKATSVKTLINSKDERLKFSVFAVEETQVRCFDGPLESMSLDEVRDLATYWGLGHAPYIKLKDGWSVEALYAEARANGWEGWMLKDGNLLNWQKLKEFKTIDLIVCGYEEGKGKHEGLIGSLVCRTAEGHVVANVGGMTDDLREQISIDEEAYMHSVVEVSYQYVGAKGKLRHPTFVQFRNDKQPNECTLSQDLELEEYYAKHNGGL